MIDLKLDANNDLLVENGDFVLGECFDQEVKLLLELSPGNLKSYPLLGAALTDFVNNEASRDELKLRIKRALKSDNKDLTTAQMRALLT